MGKVKAICISERRGTQKHCIEKADFTTDWGIVGDAHGGNWHRQISLLSFDKIEDFRKKGADIDFGAFGENIVVEGYDFRSLPVGTRFQCNDVVLEMTQIGKECHTHCQIYHKMGDCIMPREGVFAKVIAEGTISVGDEMKMLEPREDRPLQAAVITLSDKGFKGEREDKSGPLLASILEEQGYEVVESIILPDVQSQIEKELIRLSDGRQVDLILTTGGTGLSVRDVTPEATLAVATRNVPGISEAIRAYSMGITKRAMLSRGASVLRNSTLIINLPGSPKAVKESMEVILSELDHGLKILKGSASECAR
ncbi:MOSC domain-containing protein [Lachnoclostridium phytofermentans]|uniref:Molybdenum cofactor synthesis domain protein n=1 Tax=Lachnoclostridium phytofermentans (strain ATCC 700394 / DSM 18823 / ISDg) TaxID=357809 RepID=A9KPV6_LACP7|nr:MOSC domain-containing protein [Lachnoclostridium phytofermentans]ABX41855.1 molybdenum cofactor synthesis domain protein [Lachnoclostridium phytofermentans ISDg]